MPRARVKKEVLSKKRRLIPPCIQDFVKLFSETFYIEKINTKTPLICQASLQNIFLNFFLFITILGAHIESCLPRCPMGAASTLRQTRGAPC